MFIVVGVCFEAKSQEIPLGNLAPNNINHEGKAWLNFLSRADSLFAHNVVMATFEPKAKLNWHSHSKGQQLIVISGLGHYQEENKPIQVLKPGIVINCPPNIEHWHSSTKISSVTYLAIYPPIPTKWVRELSEEEYDKSLLRTLFDELASFSNEKNIKEQVLKFTPNAVVETYREDKLSSSYSGRFEIEEGVTSFLNQFESVHYENDTHEVTVKGNKAEGYGTSNVRLSNANDTLNYNIEYFDTYIKTNGTWFIQKRVSKRTNN